MVLTYRISWGHGVQTGSAGSGSDCACVGSGGSQGGHFRRRKGMRWTEGEHSVVRVQESPDLSKKPGA
jgi:hypothetical protein